MTFALALLSPVRAHAPALAVLAKRTDSIVLTDRAALAVLACAAPCAHRSTHVNSMPRGETKRQPCEECRRAPHLFILPCGQTWDPPHSLHVDFWRWSRHKSFSRALEQTQGLQPGACTLWTQMAVWLPQSLQKVLRRPCSHRLPPLHSLQVVLMLLCSQTCDPPHSRHRYLRRLCWHMYLEESHPFLGALPRPPAPGPASGCCTPPAAPPTAPTVGGAATTGPGASTWGSGGAGGGASEAGTYGVEGFILVAGRSRRRRLQSPRWWARAPSPRKGTVPLFTLLPARV